MEFSKYTLKTDTLGYKFAKIGIMQTKDTHECMMCGKPTQFVETISEGYFCSDECVSKFYDEMNKCLGVEEGA